MRIKIVSDGDPGTAAITDADTGADMSGLRISRIVLDARERHITATLTVNAVVLDLVVGHAKIERIATLHYDLDDIDSMDRVIATVQEQRAARAAS